MKRGANFRSGKQFVQNIARGLDHGFAGVERGQEKVPAKVCDFCPTGGGQQAALGVIDLDLDGVIQLRSDECVAVVAVDQNENLPVGAGSAKRCFRRISIGIGHRRGEFAIGAKSSDDDFGDFLCHRILRGGFDPIGNSNTTAGDADQFRPDVALAERHAFIDTGHSH